MGKSLIIKGADFSAVAIPSLSDELYDSIADAFIVHKTLTKVDDAVFIGDNDNNARACIWDVDLTPYYNAGYTKVTFTFNSGKSYVLAVGPSSNNVTTDWTWRTTSPVEVTLNANNARLFMNLKNTDDSDVDENSVLSDFIISAVLS